MSVAPIEVSGGPREFAVLQEISPSVAIGILCAAQILLWTIAPTIANDALPLDVVENGAWGPEWLLSSYKNPALSSWCLELIRLATGSLGWPAYLVSQLFVSATLRSSFSLARKPWGQAGRLRGHSS
jgi:4-amino-4-deoxy-L-arabinose transferase-like glycosyltransferase